MSIVENMTSFNEEEEEECKYIKTATHNYISEKAIIDNPKVVELKGKSIIMDNCRLRGDMMEQQSSQQRLGISIGRYCWISKGCIIRPSSLLDGMMIPCRIQNYVQIGMNCIIEASWIGNCTMIGHNVILGKRSIIKDNVVIRSNTVIPPDMVIPPFSYVQGSPAKICTTQTLPESIALECMEQSITQFQTFSQQQQ